MMSLNCIPANISDKGGVDRVREYRVQEKNAGIFE